MTMDRQIGHIIAENEKKEKFVFYVFQETIEQGLYVGDVSFPGMKRVENVNGGHVNYLPKTNQIQTLDGMLLSVVEMNIKEIE